MITNIVECIMGGGGGGGGGGVRMLPNTSFVEVTFYQCVTYFEKRCAEIRAQTVN